MEGISTANRRMKMFNDIFLFKKLSAQTLFNLYFACDIESIPKDSVIIESGQQSDLFYIIDSGKVAVYKGNERNNENMITSLHRGDMFGENALRGSRHRPRSASVVAQTNCTVLKIGCLEFRSIIENDREGRDIDFDFDLARMTRMRPFVKEILSKTYLFQHLSSEQINLIASLLQQERVYPQ